MIGYLLLAAALIGVDVAIKYWAVAVLAPVTTIPVIPGVFSLYYHQNYGAAWGIFQGQRAFLLIVTGVVLLGLTIALALKKFHGRLVNLSVALIIAGGVGNLLDRLFREGGYVVDYLYFELINFPIFNFADSCVVVGTCLLAIYIIFLEGKKKDLGPTPQQPQQ